MGKYKYCANCGNELVNSYYCFLEGALNGSVFFELDGSDNVFCSPHCACETLGMVEKSIQETDV